MWRRYTSIIHASITAFKKCHTKCVPIGIFWHKGTSTIRTNIEIINIKAPIAKPLDTMGNLLYNNTEKSMMSIGIGI